MSRFFVAKEERYDCALELYEQGFTEIGTLETEDEPAQNVFIDAESKSYFLSNERGLKFTNEINVGLYGEGYNTVTLKDIQKWKDQKA